MVTATQILKLEERQKHIETTDGETEVIKITRSQFRVLLRLSIEHEILFTKYEQDELNNFLDLVAQAYGGKTRVDAQAYFLDN